MKKSVIAIFSISITAGTIYLTYSQMKGKMINKLVKTWMEEAKKLDKSIDETYLKDELDKLYLWDIKLLLDYFNKVFHKASKEVLTEQLKKITARKILTTADLRSVERTFGGS